MLAKINYLRNQSGFRDAWKIVEKARSVVYSCETQEQLDVAISYAAISLEAINLINLDKRVREKLLDSINRSIEARHRRLLERENFIRKIFESPYFNSGI